MNRTELDALHGRMTAGEWTHHNSGAGCHVRSRVTLVTRDILDCDAAGIVALKNAWPIHSAKLASQEAELAAKDARIAELEAVLAKIKVRSNPYATDDMAMLTARCAEAWLIANNTLKGTTDE